MCAIGEHHEISQVIRGGPADWSTTDPRRPIHSTRGSLDNSWWSAIHAGVRFALRCPAIQPPRGLSAVVGLTAILSAAVACSEDASSPAAEGSAAPVATASAGDNSPKGFVLPPAQPFEPNPLGLAAPQAFPAQGSIVYAIPKAALAELEEGSTVILNESVVEGRDGNAVIVRRGWHSPYPIHPGYVISLNQDRLRRGDFVLAPYRQRLRHAVIVTLLHRQAVIRYTDLGRKLADQRVKPTRLGRIAPGLNPGALAVYEQGSDWHHVMLISKSGDRWFAIGHGGEAKLLAESSLVELPRSFRPKPKVGSTMWVAWRGEMVDATVRKVESPELFVLKRPRAGGTIVAGIGQLMHPH